MPSTAGQSAPVVTHGRVSGHHDLASHLGYLRDPLAGVAAVADNNHIRPHHLHHQPHPTPHKNSERYSNNNSSHHPHQNQSPKPQLNSSYNHSKKYRERTYSNTSTTSAVTTAIDPKTLQYTSKFCGTNNTVTVSSLTATSHSGGPTAGGIGATSTASAMAISAISTTTTFYSGVKLAPPVLNASVESIKRRTSDQKPWYMIQVIPCDLKILSAATGTAGNSQNSSNGTSSNGAGGSVAATATKTFIPRKPYRIYRRYEDVADFADQLEEEFPRLIASSAVTSLLRGDSKDSNATAPSVNNSFGIHVSHLF
ncbi:hypothetical protein BGZ58_004534 [Dissophora ornata]|nr:hypothetical protein BGZ58_004534 [Dissophora ornata]